MKAKYKSPSAFKHQIGKELLTRIADAILKVDPSFDKKTFLQLLPRLADLEMKSRVQLVRDELHKLLLKNYPQALKLLIRSTRSAALEGFDLWPYTEFIQTYGLNDLPNSLRALKQLTTLFTAEWAIRPFIKAYREDSLAFLERCASDPDFRVRRWSSEGSRPRLPWGERLQELIKEPQLTASILDQLKYDPELFVRKSVANHLNDIAKDHPAYVIKVLKKWQAEAPAQHRAKVDWIIRHSLRTLIKSGHAEALSLIGVSQNAAVKLESFTIKKKRLKIGEQLNFSITLRSSSAKTQKVVVDYLIHFVKANQRTRPKVFKLRTYEIPAKQLSTIEKSHSLKKITTRDYYPGQHVLEIQVNGKILGRLNWNLHMD